MTIVVDHEEMLYALEFQLAELVSDLLPGMLSCHLPTSHSCEHGTSGQLLRVNDHGAFCLSN